MAALAEATDRIQLYGSVALPTVHPAITARRGAIVDHISQGRFGINLVPGWQKDEKRIMLIFPECLEGLQVFGEQVLPRLRTAKLPLLRDPHARTACP